MLSLLCGSNYILHDYVIPILIAVINSTLIALVAYRFLQAFQIVNYKPNEFFGWMKNTRARHICRIAMAIVLAELLLFLVNILFGHLSPDYIASCGLIFYIIFISLYIFTDRNQPSKVELNYTARIKRILVAMILITFGLSFGLLSFSNYIQEMAGRKLIFIRYSSILITPLLTPFIMLTAYYILLPFEKLNNNRYIKRTKKKLDSCQNLIKIGITGSYGKTGVKDILFEIIGDERKVVKTPNSFNTPLGISRTVLNEVNNETQIFIAEMGAKRPGDIKELCDIVKPTIGVLTGITSQHMKTFKTLSNIKRTKYELIDSLPSEGFTFFNCNDKNVLELQENCKMKNKFNVGVDENFMITSMKCDCSGSKFTASINGTEYEFETALLGIHNVQNIMLAIAVAVKLGISIQGIIERVARLECTPHRLQLVKSINDIMILDDAYNSNPEGAKCALNVLSYFEGRKIIVTPGFIEMGDVAREENFEFAKHIAKVCDFVVLVGKIQTADILNGLREQNYPEENVITAINLDEAKEKLVDLLSNNSVVLFENDLPDNYTEVV